MPPCHSKAEVCPECYPQTRSLVPLDGSGIVKASLSISKPKEALLAAKEVAKAMPTSARALSLPAVAYMHLDQGTRVGIKTAPLYFALSFIFLFFPSLIARIAYRG